MIIDIDGRIYTESEAQISALDSGLYFGLGAYETMKVFQGIPLFWEEHIERLKMAVSYLQLKLDNNFFIDLKSRIIKLLEAQDSSECRLRILVTAGRFSLGQIEFTNPTSLIYITSLSSDYSKSYELFLSSYLKETYNPLPSYLKQTANIKNILSARQAHQYGCNEAILLDREGNITEGSFSNIFLIENDEIFTCPLENDILDGITRRLVLEVCEKLSLSIHVERVKLEMLEKAESVFLTSSTRAASFVPKISTELSLFSANETLQGRIQSAMPSGVLTFKKHQLIEKIVEAYIESENHYYREQRNAW